MAGVGELAENEPKAADVVNVVELFVDFLFGKDALVVEDGGFHVGDAAEAPAGDGEGADQVAFDTADGLVEVFVVGEEFVEAGLGFVGKGVEGGAESVLAGVLGGTGFAFGGDGSAGFGAVGAGGVGFGLRCHG